MRRRARQSHGLAQRGVRAAGVLTDDGTLEKGRLFAQGAADEPYDGMRLDDTGRVWTAAGKSVHCYDPDGTLIGRLLLPYAVANLVFGGLKRNRLFVAASTSLYSIMLNVTGARPVWA
ncbi:SMP-30/gluconolactonase/LRE family protein [Nonomuraea sp. RK-328]|nr:SMP-30/gluconolactonase/LRE family protein [Nonomuraea sp. RK-328]